MRLQGANVSAPELRAGLPAHEAAQPIRRHSQNQLLRRGPEQPAGGKGACKARSAARGRRGEPGRGCSSRAAGRAAAGGEGFRAGRARHRGSLRTSPSLRFLPDKFSWPLFLAAFNSPWGTEVLPSVLSGLKPARGSRPAAPRRRDMPEPPLSQPQPRPWRAQQAPPGRRPRHRECARAPCAPGSGSRRGGLRCLRRAQMSSPPAPGPEDRGAFSAAGAGLASWNYFAEVSAFNGVQRRLRFY